MRYYYNATVHDSFLHFQSPDSLDPEGLTKIIVGYLERHGLDYRNNLVDQGYDWASIMSGKHSGGNVGIKRDARFAFYVIGLGSDVVLNKNKFIITTIL